LFSDFKKKQLLQTKGSTLIIRNKPALEKVLNSEGVICRRAVTPNRRVATFPKSLPALRIRRVPPSTDPSSLQAAVGLCDLTAQPASKSFFQFDLRAAAIKIVNGLPRIPIQT